MIKKIIRFFNWHLSGIKLRYKLFFSYVVLIVLPLGIFSFLTFDEFTNILQNRIVFSTQKNFDQTFSYLSVTLKKVMHISDVAMMNQDIQGLFAAKKSDQNIMYEWEVASKASKFLDTLKDSDISDIELYLSEDSPYIYKGTPFISLEGMDSAVWYNLLITSTSKLLWNKSSYIDTSDSGSLSVIRNVKNPNNLKENKGIIRIDFKEATVKNILIRATSVKGSLTYIQNSQGVPISVSDLKLYEEYNISPSEALKSQSTQESFLSTEIQGKKVYYQFKELEQTDWYLITVIPYDEIFSETYIMQHKIFILLLFIATIAFGFAWYLTYSMTKRIYLLTGKMKEVQKGKLNFIKETSQRDEIGELTKNYNYMLKTISQLIEERYKAGIEIKNTELKLLQAQINPHFLYNTLDMINWLAQKNKASEVEQAINSLTSFYKLGLSNGKDEIPIKDEIEHISAYVQLQNMRYQNKIFLVIEVEEEIQEYTILKLTLQPIVENAILHGIMNKPSREGTIIIEAKMEKDVVVIYIQDDGIGMTEENIEKLMLSKLISKHNSGYGIKNIIQRMKLFYGEQFGLTYRSSYGMGTTVEIRIPAKEISDVEIKGENL